MKRLFLVVGTAVVILPWLAGAKAQADAIHWTASGSPLGQNVGSSEAANIYPQNGVTDALIDVTPGHTTSGTNSGSVVLANLYAIDGSNSNASFGGPSADYSLGLTLRDSTSGASGLLTFRGNLSGFINLPEEGAPAPITNTFLGSTTQTLKLGQNLYTVTIGSFVPPGNPVDPVGGGGTAGSLSASIAVQPEINSAPEPSSLMLACLGLPPLGLARWFRQRRRKDVDGTASQA